MSALTVLPAFRLPRPPAPEPRQSRFYGGGAHGTFPDTDHRLERLRARYERAHTALQPSGRLTTVTVLTPLNADDQLEPAYAYAEARQWRVVHTQFAGLGGLVDACLHVRRGYADGILANGFYQLTVSQSEYEALLDWLDIHRGFLAHALAGRGH